MNQTESLYTKDCIRTQSGIYINVFEPTPEMITIEDIAHSLSHQCRFGGHLYEFYSVAQHSTSCAYLITDDHLKLGTLMHDASEAYLLDIPRPIKLRLPDYKQIEDRLMRVIAEKFGFEYPLDPKIKAVDEVMLEYEWGAYFLRNIKNAQRIKSPYEARADFLRMFKFYNQKTELKC